MNEALLKLLGRWEGEGTALFPTITEAAYIDTLTFSLDEPHDLIQYEQKTWRKETQKQSHWEFGFIRQLDDGTVVLNNTQNNGRFEVMSSSLTPQPGRFLLHFTTTAFSNDPRMVKAEREWRVEGDTLTYVQSMATQTVPDLQAHLRATLHKKL